MSGESNERSAEDLAAIDRASRAGEKDGEAGEYDPDDKSSDTPDQREAYDASYGKASK